MLESLLRSCPSTQAPQASEAGAFAEIYALDRDREAGHHSSGDAESNREMHTGPLDCSYLDFNGEDLGLFPLELKIAN